MHLIKLSAISSTNDFLKQLSVASKIDDFTVVWADIQTKGKGQMGASWVTEGAKNLTFSAYVSADFLLIDHLFTWNVMVANAVVKALHFFNLKDISIKWPNDILAGNKKIAGILIENSIQTDGRFSSIVGIGINLEQTDFTDFPNASSVFKQFGIKLNREELLQKIVFFLAFFANNLKGEEENQWTFFHEYLFKKECVCSFQDQEGIVFNGIIKGVNRQGQLVVLREDDGLHYYNLKEVKLMY